PDRPHRGPVRPVPSTARTAVCRVILALALGVLGLAAPGAVARADSQRSWIRAIPDQATWDRYSKELGGDEFGKFIIDVRSNDIYFIDVNLFNLHADFVLGVLLKQAWTAENIREYNKNYERTKPRFILGYLTHHAKVGRWSFSFWEGDQIDVDGIVRVKRRLDEAFFVKAANLPFRPDSPMQEKLHKAVRAKGIGTVSNDELYKTAPYQAFNRGTATGTLRVVRPGTAYESLAFDRHDIVLLQESYPDITPVAGILATTFSTPLSHVNLRAAAWGIPNAGDKQAQRKYAALDGKVVVYTVEDRGAEVRIATPAEVTAWKQRIETARKVVLPAANLDNPRLAMLTRIRAKDVTSYGTKTANLGEIRTANLDVKIPDGFGVPFFYYVRHVRQHGLDRVIEAVLSDPRFGSDASWRKQALEEVRTKIVATPIDPRVLDILYKRVRVALGGKGVFVRSSTNAEDLPGFNGAGLYDTVPNVVGRAALGEAVKTVWASLWNLRAVEERSLFGIDHRQTYAAVMIQIGVDATAAGVLVTTNLYDRSDDDGFTINAKWGLGMRTVEGQKVPEQIIFDATNDGTKIISRSDEATMLVFDGKGGIVERPAPAGTVILTEARAKRLVTAVRQFMPLFPPDKPLDVEWVLEGETIWIVQARPFVSGR
ncbi:MAG: PEP/pyruvate-binding domain-containing protein, partial [Kofleriaceae bacterium]|nr:PEP/pyruvate-binding domain-containing protein [Kofleriaceae bacterium]